MKRTNKLKRIQTAIDYTLRTDAVQKGLNKVGMSKAEVIQGRGLLEHVQMLDAAQQKEYGERYQATDELNQARQQAKTLYKKHIEVARFALKEQRGYWKTLELSGARKDDLFGWLAQAHTFYSNVYQVKETLAQYNLPEAELQQGESMIDAVIEAYNVRQKEDNEAQAATQLRNEALDKLEVWMRRFTQAARLAFVDDMQTLKGLGLVSKVNA